MLCGARDGDDELARQLGNLRSGSRALHGETVKTCLRSGDAGRSSQERGRKIGSSSRYYLAAARKAETSLAKFDESVGLLTSRLSEGPAG